jgi:hypothetical protein
MADDIADRGFEGVKELVGFLSSLVGGAVRCVGRSERDCRGR